MWVMRTGALLVALALLGACGDDDGGSSERSSSPSPAGSGASAGVTEVRLELLTARVENGRAVAHAEWTSGVAPCHVLDHADADRKGARIDVRVFEGGDPDAVCVELAERHSAEVDLGRLPPGRYAVTAQGVEGPLRVDLEVP